MPAKEAQARIKINQLLMEAGWRFFDDANGPANVRLEPHIKLTKKQIETFGEDFEKTPGGFVDFLLLDEKGFPFLVLEAKAEDKEPLIGKEQARQYARSSNVKYVILSNGNLHYFWNIEKGNPQIITTFPTCQSLKNSKAYTADPMRLVNEEVTQDYIARTQIASYDKDPRWLNESERSGFIKEQGLRFLRIYQQNAIQALQKVTIP